MSFELKKYEEFIAQANAEIRRVNPDLDPTVFGSFTVPYNKSAAALAYSVQQIVVDLAVQLFPQTAEGEFLERWAEYEDLERVPASAAEGSMSISGTATGHTIEPGDEFLGSNGLTYEVQTAGTTENVGQTLTTLLRSGTTVTATVDVDHTLASGLSVTVSGANEADYNGTFTVTVIATNQFTYEVSTTPTTPATGTIVYTSLYASFDIAASADTGQETNIDSGGVLTVNFDNTVSSFLSSTGFAQFDGISGGAEIETDDALRARTILSRSILEGVFTEDAVKLAALSIAGNTRAFVVRPTFSVASTSTVAGTDAAPGQVIVYILRDDDDSITPTQTVLDNTKAAIIADGELPAHSSEADVFVFAPTLVATAFTFTAISPDTSTMQSAIEAQLKAFFEDTVSFETTVTEASYLGAIQNTQDLVTGDLLTSFTLSAPTTDITVSSGQLAVLGDVTFV